jgi:hypothetical protein
LTGEEKEECSHFCRLAKAGDTTKSKVIEPQDLVKEIKLLMYVPVKWKAGKEPAEGKVTE